MPFSKEIERWLASITLGLIMDGISAIHQRPGSILNTSRNGAMRKREQIVTDFRAFAEMGLFAVRWFILADGLSYGVGEAAPKKVGHLWAFDPLPGDHPFHWSAKATDEATTWTNADQLGAIGFINASANGDSNDE